MICFPSPPFLAPKFQLDGIHECDKNNAYSYFDGQLLLVLIFKVKLVVACGHVVRLTFVPTLHVIV